MESVRYSSTEVGDFAETKFMICQQTTTETTGIMKVLKYLSMTQSVFCSRTDRACSQRFKPKRSYTLVEHGQQAFKETLPCQVPQGFESHVKRPNLPSLFNGNDELDKSDDKET